jgi:hypothetical protein
MTRRPRLFAVLVVSVLSLSACQLAKVGAKCNPSQGAARNATHVLFCVKGRWKATVTIGQAAQIIIGNLPGGVAPAGAGSVDTTPDGTIAGFLGVIVTTRSGGRAGGAVVRFSAPASGATLAGTKEFTITADPYGLARLPAGQKVTTTAGTFAIRATVDGLEAQTEIKVNIKAGPAVKLEATSPTDLDVHAGQAPPSYTFTVRDKWGNPTDQPAKVTTFMRWGNLPDELETLTAVQTGSTITATAPEQTVLGHGEATLWLSPTTGIAISTVVVKWDVGPGPADAILTGGDDQSTSPGMRFGSYVTVQVVDEFDNVVHGVPVTLTVIAGPTGASGTLANVTDYGGAGAGANVDANSVPGDFTVRADVGDLGYYDFTLHIS